MSADQVAGGGSPRQARVSAADLAFHPNAPDNDQKGSTGYHSGNGHHGDSLTVHSGASGSASCCRPQSERLLTAARKETETGLKTRQCWKKRLISPELPAALFSPGAEKGRKMNS
ncbi:MAG TPA: hypothetical protein VNQ79_25190 [Blastocatellia bacterium]|nr:hypothetical protein [Blastocatellia bacterium]